MQDADLDAATPAQGWDVRDAVSHLAGSDEEALLSATDPDAFVAKLPEIAQDIEGFLTGQLTSRRGLAKDDLLARWQHGFDQMVQAFAAVPPGTKLPWYGPPMSPASFATARLMEYWAHGQDVVDALGAERAGTHRLRHICHLAVRTRGFAYVNRGFIPPTEDVFVGVTAPSGETWGFGDVEAANRVAGTALDFCLLTTQRRHRDDTDLVATGPVADEWLSLAQIFAGPPGPGRSAT
ncbi:MAG: TIGR03084 family metal-binding protein [Mycobacteriales bacterium]